MFRRKNYMNILDIFIKNNDANKKIAHFSFLQLSFIICLEGEIEMKLPNGYGSVYRLKGTRRNSYRVVISQGYSLENGNVKLKRTTLGYYSTKKEALEALTNYHENPYDIKAETMTFQELYMRWSEDHFKTLSNKSSIRTYKAAFNHSKPLHNMRFKDIRPNHLEGVIENAVVGDATKSRMKSMYNLMYRYAIKYDIIDKNYAELCNSVKVNKKNIKVPFTVEEVHKLWEFVDKVPFVDMVLIGIYSGFRPIELTMIKTKNVHLKEGYIIGGTKTSAGRNRIVPIHPQIESLIRKRYDEENEYLFSDYNIFTREISPLTYDKYRGRFRKVMSAVNMNHTPHETRHTFITQAKYCKVNEYILKKIVGHEIRDVTEAVYTHRNIEDLKKEIVKVKY